MNTHILEGQLFISQEDVGWTYQPFYIKKVVIVEPNQEAKFLEDEIISIIPKKSNKPFNVRITIEEIF